MYRNILIPTDGSDLSDKAISHGVALASAIGSRITFVTVADTLHSMSGEPEMVVAMPEEYKRFVHTYLTEETDQRLAAARAAAKASGVECETICVQHEHPHQAIIDTAQREGCDLILMASHGRRGVSAVILGSETSKVLTHSAIPVLVYR